MGAQLIVDGHNVIFRSPKWSEAYGRDSQGTRARMIRQLAEFGARKHYRVTVVFDTGKGETGYRSSEEQDGVSIHFPRGGESADDLIGEICAKLPKGEPVFVASSDRGVAAIARANGGIPWSAEELLRKMTGPAAKRRPSDWHPIEHGVKGYTGDD